MKFIEANHSTTDVGHFVVHSPKGAFGVLHCGGLVARHAKRDPMPGSSVAG